MNVLANVDQLRDEGIISADAARIIVARSRQTMVALGINTLLCGGIVAATAGMIVWLADPLSVSVSGLFFMITGFLVLVRNNETYRMFGNAAALIGGGLLIGGGAVELVDKYRDIAGPVMFGAGALLAAIGGACFKKCGEGLRLSVGALALMGVALHLIGGYGWLDESNVSGLPVSLYHFYVAAAIALSGWFLDIRLVTALAIVPFAQMFDTSTSYFHAAYVFYSPEPALSVLQMGTLVAAVYWLASRTGERQARHLRTVGIMGFIVANLCALVGSLWGDIVGSHIWGPEAKPFGTYEDHRAAIDSFRETALFIPDWAFSIGWALALAALVFVAAHRNNRILFNASLTFAGIHAYTQLFESFGDEPLAYVIGGLCAIPGAWAIWRANDWFMARPDAEPAANA